MEAPRPEPADASPLPALSPKGLLGLKAEWARGSMLGAGPLHRSGLLNMGSLHAVLAVSDSG